MSLFSKAHFVFLLPLIGISPSHSPVPAQDCNQNGIQDYVDVAPWVKLLDEREFDLGFSPEALISADFNGAGLSTSPP